MTLLAFLVSETNEGRKKSFHSNVHEDAKVRKTMITFSQLERNSPHAERPRWSGVGVTTKSVASSLGIR